jgi:catabolite regulation protein CreA
MANRSKVQQWSTGIVVALVAMGSAAVLVSCEQKRHVVGSVNTEFKLIGPDH